jgi:hypothetical protein
MVALNVLLNKQSRKANKGQPSGWGLDLGLTASNKTSILQYVKKDLGLDGLL